jgi:hypothetical protein
MSARTLTDVNDDIARCQWLRTHMRYLSEVLAQDSVLDRLTAERAALTGQETTV